MTGSGGEHFVGAYRAFAANGASGAPPWLKEMRERAIARFAEVGFPTTRLEQWRFTSVQPIIVSLESLLHQTPPPSGFSSDLTKEGARLSMKTAALMRSVPCLPM